MKNTLTVLLLGLLLCGCSQKQATSATPAIDLVEARKAVEWSNGYVLYVGKRSGASLEDIHVSYKDPKGRDVTILQKKARFRQVRSKTPKTAIP